MSDISFFQANGYRNIEFLECYSFNRRLPSHMVELAKVFMQMKSTEDKLAKFFIKKVALLGLGRFALRHDTFHSRCFEIQNLAHFQLVQDSEDLEMLSSVNRRLFGIAKPEYLKSQKIRSAYTFNVCPVVFSEIANKVRQEMYNFESFLAKQNQLFHIRTDCDCIAVLFPKQQKYILSKYFKMNKNFSYKQEGTDFIQCTNFKRCKYIMICSNNRLTLKCFGLSLSLFERFCNNMIISSGKLEYDDFIYKSIDVKHDSIYTVL